MLYLFLFTNILILIRTFGLNSEIQVLEKIKKLVNGFNKKDINERYVSSKLSGLVFCKNSVLIKWQILNLILFLVLLVEYVYVFIDMFLTPLYPILYIILCLWFFKENESVKRERVLLLFKIFCIIALLNF